MLNFPFKKIVFVFLIFGISCSSYRKIKPLKIDITSAQLYKYDLSHETYTVFFTNEPPQVIKFHLTDKELKAIGKKYYSLGLDKIKKTQMASDELIIEDKCEEMPKLITVLQVESSVKKQKK